MKQHLFYEPTDEFIQRLGLHIEEAETWVELIDKESILEATRGIGFNKETGQVRLWIAPSRYLSSELLFDGYLPDEAALEAVIKWTNWAA